MQEMGVRSLSQEDSLEEEMAAHSGILTWEMPRTGEPGRLQCMRSQKNQTQLSDWTVTVTIPGEIYLQELAHTFVGASKFEVCRSAGWSARAASLEAEFLPLSALQSFPLTPSSHWTSLSTWRRRNALFQGDGFKCQFHLKSTFAATSRIGFDRATERGSQGDTLHGLQSRTPDLHVQSEAPSTGWSRFQERRECV